VLLQNQFSRVVRANDFPILAAILVSLHLHLIGAFGLLRDRISLLFVRLQ